MMRPIRFILFGIIVLIASSICSSNVIVETKNNNDNTNNNNDEENRKEPIPPDDPMLDHTHERIVEVVEHLLSTPMINSIEHNNDEMLKQKENERIAKVLEKIGIYVNSLDDVDIEILSEEDGNVRISTRDDKNSWIRYSDNRPNSNKDTENHDIVDGSKGITRNEDDKDVNIDDHGDSKPEEEQGHNELQEHEGEYPTKNNNNMDDHNVNVPQVIELTSRTFSHLIGDGSLWLIEFYSPHCGHCVQFAPVYDEIAYHFHEQNNQHMYSKSKNNNKNNNKKKNKKYRNVKVAKINAGEELALSSRFNVRVLPTFFIIDGWNVYEYDESSRSKDRMIQYITSEQYKNQTEPIPFYVSPMGLVGQIQGCTISMVYFTYDMFLSCQQLLGLQSQLLTGMIFFGTMFVSCFIFIVTLAIVVPPSSTIHHIKND